MAEPTLDEIKAGMSLNEILGSDAPSDVYGSLKSTSVHALDDSLNPRVPGGVSSLMEQLAAETDPTRQQEIADAICAELLGHKDNINADINTDLAAQAVVVGEKDSAELVSQIVPIEIKNTDLFNIVATDNFKTIIDAVADATAVDEDEEDDG
jgi:hypothetical protein